MFAPDDPGPVLKLTGSGTALGAVVAIQTLPVPLRFLVAEARELRGFPRLVRA